MKLSYDSKYQLKESFADFSDFLKKHQDWTGWLNLEKLSEESLIAKIIEKSQYIRENCDVFLLVGIGGSYSGAKAIIESLKGYFVDSKPEIYYVGNSLSSEYLFNLKEKIKDKDIVINYISKSGSTLETKVVLEELEKLMAEKYEDSELQKRIIYTTSNPEIVPEGFDYFLIPNNVGGRFSVFTPVGLLPVAVAGIDIRELLDGAKAVDQDLAKEYALFRKKMIESGKEIEAYVVYEPKLDHLLEWVKQVYAESLGKNNQGIFPAGLVNTRDLHSYGQYLQEGKQNVFETVLVVDEKVEIMVPAYGKNLSEINKIAQKATTIAHQERVPNLIIEVGILDAFKMGQLLQFFMLSCVMSGYLEKVNPFDQEGVEGYKKEMLKLLT